MDHRPAGVLEKSIAIVNFGKVRHLIWLFFCAHCTCLLTFLLKERVFSVCVLSVYAWCVV